MEWHSDYEIGVEPIDAQHRELFRRTGRLLAAVEQGDGAEVGRTLTFLRAYVVEHFGAEQAAMAAAGYPLADAHAEEHALFARRLLALEAEHASAPTSPWLATKLTVELASWLRQHILGADRDLGRFLRGSASGQ
jgi:hemerythrin